MSKPNKEGSGTIPPDEPLVKFKTAVCDIISREHVQGFLRQLISEDVFTRWPGAGWVASPTALKRARALGGMMDIEFSWDIIRVYPASAVNDPRLEDHPMVAAQVDVTLAPRSDVGPWYIALISLFGEEYEASVPVVGGDMVVHRVTAADRLRPAATASALRRQSGDA